MYRREDSQIMVLPREIIDFQKFHPNEIKRADTPNARYFVNGTDNNIHSFWETNLI